MILIREIYNNNNSENFLFYPCEIGQKKSNHHQTTILFKFSISKNVTETNPVKLASVLILIREIYHKNKSENVTNFLVLIQRLSQKPNESHAKSNPCQVKFKPS